MPSLLKSTLNTRPLIKGSYKYIRSDVPYRLTDDEISFLIEKNITTIIDLRTAEEIKRKPLSFNDNPSFTYVNMPVSGGNIVPDSQDSVSKSYLNMLDKQMEKIISYIENAKSNVLFFCNAGKDRTGVVSALLMKRSGFTDEEIIDDYLLSADNLCTLLNSYAESENIDIKIITPQKRYMEEFLRGLSL